MWKISFQTMLHHPLGVGIGGFAGAYGEEQGAYFESGGGSEVEEYVAGGPEYAFNEYLQIGIEQGILSLLLFLAAVVYALYKGLKNRNTGIIASLVALLIFAFASYPFSVLPFLIVLAFLLSMSAQKEVIGDGIDNYPKRTVPTSIQRRIFYVLFSISGLVITALCICDRYPGYEAYQQWKRSQMLYQAGLYKDAADDYARLYPLLSDQIRFLFEYGQNLSRSEQYRESNEVLEKAVKISCDPMLYNVMGKNYQALKDYVQAESCFRKAALIVPSRTYPYYLLAKLYIETGEQEKALEMAQVVLTKEPKVMSTAIKEMREEMDKILRK
jgi:tetratricopeptide (TPR) repeat protein